MEGENNMAGLDLSTAGIHIYYGVETTAGTKPTDFTDIPKPMEIPQINAAPSMIKTTSLNETTYETYIKGLIDVGSAIGIKFGLNDEFQEIWATLCTASETARETGKATWFQVVVPDMKNAFFFTGQPSILGFDATSPNSHLQDTAYITPNEIKGWSAKVVPSAP